MGLAVVAAAGEGQEDGVAVRPRDVVAFHTVDGGRLPRALRDKLLPLFVGGEAEVGAVAVGPVVFLALADVGADDHARLLRAGAVFVAGPGVGVLGFGLAPGVVAAGARLVVGVDVLVGPLHAKAEIHQFDGRQGPHGADGGTRAATDGGDLGLRTTLEIGSFGFGGIAALVVGRPIVGAAAAVVAAAGEGQEDGVAVGPRDVVTLHAIDGGRLPRALGDEFLPLLRRGKPHRGVVVVGTVVADVPADVIAEILAGGLRAGAPGVVGPGVGVLGEGLSPGIVAAVVRLSRGVDVLVGPFHAEAEVHQFRALGGCSQREQERQQPEAGPFENACCFHWCMGVYGYADSGSNKRFQSIFRYQNA